MKTSELTGAELDAWVARAEGFRARTDDECDWWDADDGGFVRQMEWEPSTDWAHGGPIIERERINVVDHAAYQGNLLRNADEQFAAFIGDPWQLHDLGGLIFYDVQKGPTPLVAAMRAFVASKYGDTVPDEVK